jgi:hypothetical protein
MLRLYPLIKTLRQGTTTMRGIHFIVAVEPPPKEFDWKQAAFGKSDVMPARAIRTTAQVARQQPCEFTGDESRAIWLSSTSYDGGMVALAD